MPVFNDVIETAVSLIILVLHCILVVTRKRARVIYILGLIQDQPYYIRQEMCTKAVF